MLYAKVTECNNVAHRKFFNTMKCIDAQEVWSHPQGVIAGIMSRFPDAWERITKVAHGLVNGASNPFNTLVQKDAAATGVTSKFYVTHSDDTDPIAHEVHDILGDAAAGQCVSAHFSRELCYPMILGNICCSGCSNYSAGTSPKEVVLIQMAALKHNPA